MTLSGSRAYGFSNPDSDYDYRGIAIPPLDSYIGIKGKFEHAVDDKTKHVWLNYKGIVEDESDMQVYELTKFIGLAAQCNPSIIEVLFTDPLISFTLFLIFSIISVVCSYMFFSSLDPIFIFRPFSYISWFFIFSFYNCFRSCSF